MCRSLIAALVLVPLLFATAPAQERKPLAPPDTSSPRATVQAFLEEFRTFERLYTDYRSGKSTEKAKKLITGFAFPSQTTYLARDGGLDTDRAREVETRPPRPPPGPESVETVDEEGPEPDGGTER